MALTSAADLSDGSLSGRVAFITGAARGQGRAHAVRLARSGADVIGVDVCAQIPTVLYPMSSPADLDATVAAVAATGRRMVAGVADVRDRESMRIVLEHGIEQLGRLDFVIANAGIMPIYGSSSRQMQAWHDCLDVLLTGVLNTVELTYPLLIEQDQGGSIVMTGSMAAVQPLVRTPARHTLGLLGYSAAKAALENLCRNYASRLAIHRIRVNTVHPTGVNTPMIRNELLAREHATADPDDMRTLVNALPVDAIEPEDVANLVHWLCSDASRFFTGNAVRLDAGANLR